MVRDILLMENQIPLHVLQLLITLRYNEREAASFISRFFSAFLSFKKRVVNIDLKNDEIPQEIEYPPIHFLEAFQRVIVKKIKGQRNPIQYLSDLTPVVVANTIAFEVLPHGCSSLVVLSYAIFLKSLVQSPQDVKELQANGVILNRLANLEKVVEVIKEIDTFGLHDQDLFKDVKREIEEHCRSKARTWLADLIYTRFRTPWRLLSPCLLECSFSALLFCRLFLLFGLSIKDSFN
ncbi:hypothetical protein SASPL_129137 [Salvia splendens]|uniref:Uncharacterized protein n=1 Tax=Salvia splendens TaxID=180675 RepID=A0A8X8XFH3_SALSN|nr:hypothetical protein SASPL_129137 [Salvia splendens]